MGEQEIGHIESFFHLMRHYISSHSVLETILMFWNFVGSLLIAFLSLVMFNAIDQRRERIPKFRLRGTKIALVLLMVGAVFQAMKIEVVSTRAGFFFTGVLIYLIVIVISYRKNQDI